MPVDPTRLVAKRRALMRKLLPALIQIKNILKELTDLKNEYVDSGLAWQETDFYDPGVTQQPAADLVHIDVAIANEMNGLVLKILAASAGQAITAGPAWNITLSK